MKTKSVTKQRHAEREFNIDAELKGEFRDVLSDDMLDEDALVMAMSDDED
jgi:hypothetical protein